VVLMTRRRQLLDRDQAHKERGNSDREAKMRGEKKQVFAFGYL